MVAGLAMIVPETITDLVGVAVMVLVYVAFLATRTLRKSAVQGVAVDLARDGDQP
jgi:hypothetical protein